MREKLTTNKKKWKIEKWTSGNRIMKQKQKTLKFTPFYSFITL